MASLAIRSSGGLTSAFTAPLHLDFLAPRLYRVSTLRQTLRTNKRSLRTSSDSASQSKFAYEAQRPDGQNLNARTSATRQDKPTRPLSNAQRSYLDSALRVNQAGELAATLIYAAQSPIVVRREPHLRSLMTHMYDQEAGHLRTFNELLAEHRVRPTVLTPLWRIAASALGWGTALISREAAMACTEAVETEIGEHYNGQVRELLSWIHDADAHGEDIGPEIRQLIERIRVIRDEELEHLDEAVDEGAKLAEAYPVLSTVIRGGCRSAIWLSERV